MKQTERRWLRGTAVTVAVASLACASVEGCKSSRAPDAPPTSGVILASNVRVLTDADAARVIVQPDGLLFPADMTWALSLPPGTIVASGYQDGFLRRVTSASSQSAPKAVHSGVHPQDVGGFVISVLTTRTSSPEHVVIAVQRG